MFVTLAPVVVLASLLFGAAAFVTYWYSNSTDSRTLVFDFGLKVFGAAGGIASIAVACQALHLNALRQRVATAFTFLQRYDANDFLELRLFLDDQKPRAPNAGSLNLEEISLLQGDGFIETLNGRPEIAKRIRSLLGFFEDMSLAIATAHADEATLFRSLRPSVCYFIKRLSPYIVHERHRTSDALYYEDSLKLARAWSQDLSVLTGRRVSAIWLEPGK